MIFARSILAWCLRIGVHRVEQFGVSSWKQQNWWQAADDDEDALPVAQPTVSEH